MRVCCIIIMIMDGWKTALTRKSRSRFKVIGWPIVTGHVALDRHLSIVKITRHSSACGEAEEPRIISWEDVAPSIAKNSTFEAYLTKIKELRAYERWNRQFFYRLQESLRAGCTSHTYV